MVSFSEDLDGFSLRLRVEAAPRVPRARRLRVEVGSGTWVKLTERTHPDVLLILNCVSVKSPGWKLL